MTLEERSILLPLETGATKNDLIEWLILWGGTRETCKFVNAKNFSMLLHLDMQYSTYCKILYIQNSFCN